MSADPKSPKVKEMSQPLLPTPMPAYRYREDDEGDRPSYVHSPADANGEKLDLSGVVFNFN